MSKTKTPFFSMGAQGSVGESITAQKLRGETLIRGKPCPTDPYSLPQAYQRWLYEDYAYWWTQQSSATKQEYASAGVRHHLTGFQYWMSYHLRVIPDIAFWYRLDEPGGAVAHDHAPDPHHGTIIGASPATGLIDGAYYFDGLNDFIRVLHNSALNLASSFSLELFLKPDNAQVGAVIMTLSKAGAYYFLYDHTAVAFRGTFYFDSGGVPQRTLGPVFIDTLSLHHLAAVYDPPDFMCYLDGILATSNNIGIVTPTITANNFYIGNYDGYAYWFPSIHDNVILYNRALDATEVLRHSLRRYPP